MSELFYAKRHKDYGGMNFDETYVECTGFWGKYWESANCGEREKNVERLFFVCFYIVNDKYFGDTLMTCKWDHRVIVSLNLIDFYIYMYSSS